MSLTGKVQHIYADECFLIPFVKTDIPSFSFMLRHPYLGTSMPPGRHLLAPRKLRLKASFSVEAAVVLPILICAVVFVLFFFRILSVQWGVAEGLTNTGRLLALAGEVTGDSGEDKAGIIENGVLIASLESALLGEDIPFKFVKLGRGGINLLGSRVEDKDIVISALYYMDVPIKFFGGKGFSLINKYRIRRWTGYDPKEEGDGKDTFVYVTKYGVAYHERVNCVYLDPSISSVNKGEVEGMRNESGGKYYPCELCGEARAQLLYITDYGTVYHTKVSCSSLTRNIARITKNEAENSGKHACGKCYE